MCYYIRRALLDEMGNTDMSYKTDPCHISNWQRRFSILSLVLCFFLSRNTPHSGLIFSGSNTIDRYAFDAALR